MDPDLLSAPQPGILGAILTVLIGNGPYLSHLADLLSGIGDYNAGQAAVLDVVTGGHEVYQEWDGENWVNVDQTHSQPIIPWNPGSNPGGGDDPLAFLNDLIGG
ncbi:hypothetical protein [Hoyosella subflava]|uniref:Uncharacterized protein n=1 Tax=Hoyosella subflava (strain DSM 45089 / JCM 17490 / NBRC 109087 / DQS3-9A1) TaxID=443218 RepID=F6ELR1_HOYSD|nr:hypothetical protein [Hoyosella subflava]AEF41509.1 hypothetical protein AS9A_3064 [Hoyosella subflava DQS3-9A1]